MAKKRNYWSSVLDCVLSEQNENGDTLVSYTHEPSLYGPLVSEQRSNESRQYHFDALGSTRALTDESGDVTDTFTYDAWGNEVERTGTTETPFQWVGMYGYSAQICFSEYQIRARTYSPRLAVWRSADWYFVLRDVLLRRFDSPGHPIALSDISSRLAISSDQSIASMRSLDSAMNAFAYASASPVNLFDASGLLPDYCTPRCPSWCGPDVGSQLKATLLLAYQEFQNTNWFLRQWWCSNPGTWLSWDLDASCWDRPGAEGRCGGCCIGQSPDLKCCVSVFGFKHDQWNVNYLLWGAMMGLCHWSLATAISFAHAHKHKKWLFREDQCGHEATDTLDAWISAGYQVVGGHTSGTIGAPMMPLSAVMPQYSDPRFDSCNDCPEGYSTPATPCGFRWFDNNDIMP